MSELKVNKVSPATGTQVEVEAATVFIDGTLRAATINAPAGVSIQHNGSTKLLTTSTGVTVTGTVQATGFTGSGAGLTGITSTGVGGSSSTGSLSVVAASGGGGTGEIAFYTNGTAAGNLRGRVTNGGNWSLDEGTLFVDAANNRVGVNSTTPTVALDVTGTTRTTDLNVTGTLTAATFSPADVSVGTVTATTGNITNVAATTVATSTLTASGNVNVDSGTLFVDATNNRVGVVTANPNTALHVVGTATVADATNSSVLTLSASGNNALISSANSSGELVFRTNSADRLFVPSNAHGIRFPSALSALSSDANTLDAYQEGTKVFVQGDFRCATTAGTYPLAASAADRTLTYTRIGNMILFEGVITLGTITTAGSGQAQLINLPTVTRGYATVYSYSLTTAVRTIIYGEWLGSTMSFFKNNTASATTYQPFINTDFGNDSRLRFSGIARI